MEEIEGVREDFDRSVAVNVRRVETRGSTSDEAVLPLKQKQTVFETVDRTVAVRVPASDTSKLPSAFASPRTKCEAAK